LSEFINEPGCAVRVRLDENEAEMLRNLLVEMGTMLGGGMPTDPVMERLFPRAYEGDEDQEAYRELIGAELASAKKKALRSLRDGIGESGEVDVPLSQQQADDWLAAINDIRLAIGVRLNVDEEKMSGELDPDDRQTPVMALLHWLGWVQESILDAISRSQETT
jgi:hypothetical protein